MKKTKLLFTLLLTSISFASCKKDSSKVCWHCEFGMMNGQTPPPKTVCNDGEMPQGFKDENGNELSFKCEKK